MSHYHSNNEKKEEVSLIEPEAQQAYLEAKAHEDMAKQYLPKLFANDPSMTTLNLARTSCGDVALIAVADALKVNTVLTKLDLSHNNIGREGASLLAEMLESNVTLVEVDLRHNELDDDAAESLTEAMVVNNTLRVLNFREGNPDISDHGVNQLMSYVRLNNNPPQLKPTILQLNRGTVGEVINMSRIEASDTQFRDAKHDDRVHLDDWCAMLLAHHLRLNDTVTVLDLSCHHIGDQGAGYLADMLRVNRKLDRINLYGNVISDVGVRSLAQALKANNAIRSLQVFGNTVSKEALMELEWALAMNRQPLTLKHHYPQLKDNDPTLVHLELDDHLSQRYYDDIAVRLVVDGMENNTAVMSIVMTNGRITPVGARFFSDMLLANGTLRLLDLSHNPIKEGSSYLAQAIQSNTSLQSLRLIDTDMSDVEGIDLAKSLEVNSTLTELDVSQNPNIRDSGREFARVYNLNTVLIRLGVEGTSISANTMQDIEDRRRLAQEPKPLRDILPFLYDGDDHVTQVLLSGAGEGVTPLRDTSLRLLAAPLRYNFAVTELDLSHNAFSFLGLSSLCSALLENRQTTRVINISHNNIGRGHEYGTIVSALVRDHSALHTLDLTNTNLDEEACRVILNEVDTPNLNVIKKLILDGNPLIEADTLFKTECYVQCNSALGTFKDRFYYWFHKVDDNYFRRKPQNEVVDFTEYDGGRSPPDTPAAVYAHALVPLRMVLTRYKGFTTLKFSGNKISDPSAKVIAKLLLAADSLHTVELQNNFLTDTGLGFLSDAAQEKYQVRSIRLEGNALTSASARADLDAMLLYNRQPMHIKKILIELALDSASKKELDCSAFNAGHVEDTHIPMLCKALAKNHHITLLDFSNNHITSQGLGVLCEALKTNTTVRNVKMKNTLISGDEVGAYVADLLDVNNTLEAIDLSYNDIEDGVVAPIMEAARRNGVIKFIGVKHCRVSDNLVAHVMNKVSLNTQSGLKSVIPDIQSNKESLTEFQGRSAGYCNSHVLELSAAIKDNTRITSVDLSRNEELGDEGVVALMGVLATNHTITKLDLSGSSALTFLSLRAMVAALKLNNGVRTIVLRECGLTPDDLEQTPGLMGIVKSNDTLTELDLSHNRIPAADLETLEVLSLNNQHRVKAAIPRLRDNDPILTTFDAREDRLHDDVGASLLSRTLPTNTHLTCLDLSDGRVGDVAVLQIAIDLEANRTLTELHLNNSLWGDVGARALATALRLNPTLRRIGLAQNRNMTDDGAAELLGSFAFNSNIIEMDVSGCEKISSGMEGKIQREVTINNRPLEIKRTMQRLAEGEAPVSSFLDFSRSAQKDPSRPFDDVACGLVCEMLAHDRFVTKLDLSSNDLTFTSGYHLASLMETNTRIGTINLAHNRLADGSIAIVGMMKTTNTTLTDLDMTDNSVPSLDNVQLLQALNREPVLMKKGVLCMLDGDSTYVEMRIPGPEEGERREVPLLHRHKKDYLDDDSMATLSSALKNNLWLRKLSVERNRITSVGLRTILDLFVLNPGVTTLHFAHNSIDDDGALEVCKALRRRKAALTDIDLSYNVLTEAVAHEIEETIKAVPTVARFDVRGNRISAPKEERIQLSVDANVHASERLRGEVLSWMDDLSAETAANLQMYVSQGYWSEKALDLVCRALYHNTHVTELRCDFDDLTNESLDRVKTLLQKNKTITHLSLEHNNITRVAPLCEALPGSGVQVLSLRKNKLDVESAKCIAALLRDNDGLTDLDVSHNAWGSLGAKLIAAALPMNDGLRQIELEGDGIDTDVVEKGKNALTLHYKSIAIKAIE